MKGLKSSNKSSIRGVNFTQIKREVFLNQSKSGWRRLIGAGIAASSFIDKYYKGFVTLPSYKESPSHKGKIISRGTLGNSGNARLASISKADVHMQQVLDLIPTEWQHKGLNSSKKLPAICDNTTLTDVAILPSDIAYDDGTPENTTLKNIITTYLKVLNAEPCKPGKQAKASKSVPQILTDLKKDQRISGGSEVLIPRATRKFASVSILEDHNAVVSTNFIRIRIKDVTTRRLLASWVLSVFGQLQIELLATPQEGMRKIEVGTMNGFLIPNFSALTSPQMTQLTSLYSKEKPLDFNNPIKRLTDNYWAEVLSPNDSDTLLDQAFIIFNQLVDERKP